MSKRHERLLFRYSSALERGDFHAVADVLHEAERDPALEQMILDLNDAYIAERFNHMNPKEIPMIAALYQNPKPARPRANWQGLPFVAALVVIALLTVMLAVQTRGSSPMNSGNSSGNDSPAAAQISPYCTTTIRTATDVLSLPSPDGVVIGSMPAHTLVSVLDSQVYMETQQNSVLWYFVAAQGVQGWVSTYVLEAPACTRSDAGTPPPIFTVMPAEALVMATATPIPAMPQPPLRIATLPSGDAFAILIPADVQPLSTFTPTPVLQAANEAAACETPSDPNVAWLILYSRPTTTSLVVASLVGRYDVNDLIAKDSTEVDGQKWLYISTGSYSGMPQGWVTEADFNHAVNCFWSNPAWQPTIVPPATQIAETRLYMTATVQPPPIPPPAVITATPIPVTLVPVITATPVQ